MVNVFKDKIDAGTDSINSITAFTDSFHYIRDTFSNNEDMTKLLAKSYFHFTADNYLNFSGIQYCSIIYIQKGNISIACNGHLFSLEKGSIAIIPSEISFKLHTTSTDSYGYFLILNGKSINFYLNKLNIKEIYAQKLNPSSNIGELTESIYKHAENDAELIMIYYSNKLNEIFYELCRLAENNNEHNTDKHIPSYIKEIKKLFDTEYYKDYSLNFFEEFFNKNKYRISREFSSAYSIPPFQYLNKVRINEAKKLLLNSELNIREIGYEVGIKNTNHFINLFKKETGTTPLSFRKDAPDFLKNN